MGKTYEAKPKYYLSGNGQDIENKIVISVVFWTSAGKCTVSVRMGPAWWSKGRELEVRTVSGWLDQIQRHRKQNCFWLYGSKSSVIFPRGKTVVAWVKHIGTQLCRARRVKGIENRTVSCCTSQNHRGTKVFGSMGQRHRNKTESGCLHHLQEIELDRWLGP